MPNPFPARYRRAQTRAGGSCPIEAGLLGQLADNECRHGRLPGDPTPKCGCWAAEAAQVIVLTRRPRRRARRAA